MVFITGDALSQHWNEIHHRHGRKRDELLVIEMYDLYKNKDALYAQRLLEVFQ